MFTMRKSDTIVKIVIMDRDSPRMTSGGHPGHGGIGVNVDASKMPPTVTSHPIIGLSNQSQSHLNL